MIKPILKWPGAKTNIIPQIEALLPEGKRLVEPFAGSASLFMNIDKYEKYVINDINPILLHFYYYISNETKLFINLCKYYFSEENNTLERYLDLRKKFNTINAGLMDASAIFLYLNRHCFNGLVRYNKKGKYNAHFGFYKNPYFPEEEIIYFHNKDNKTNDISVVRPYDERRIAILGNMDFREFRQYIMPEGDVVYCDPPYVPLNNTANFTSYSSNKFTMKDHVDLASMAMTLRDIGVPVLISNHDIPITRELYKNATKIVSIEVSRRISCKASSRTPAKELLALYI